nr:hypothetical protein StreXyl84_24620 [Streptomyces sp. Xyl84]
MSTLGGIDDIGNDSPVTVLILDNSYNSHTPPVGTETVRRALVTKKPCIAAPWRSQRGSFKPSLQSGV